MQVMLEEVMIFVMRRGPDVLLLSSLPGPGPVHGCVDLQLLSDAGQQLGRQPVLKHVPVHCCWSRLSPLWVGASQVLLGTKHGPQCSSTSGACWMRRPTKQLSLPEWQLAAAVVAAAAGTRRQGCCHNQQQRAGVSKRQHSQRLLLGPRQFRKHATAAAAAAGRVPSSWGCPALVVVWGLRRASGTSQVTQTSQSVCYSILQ